MHYNSVSQPFSLCRTLLTNKTSCRTTLLHKKVCGTPKVLSSILFTEIHCFKAFLHKLANVIGIKIQTSSENVKKKCVNVETL